MDEIIIKGARENNLKNIDITLPKNKLIVMTGVSGSGKSSLAFDTIYAEGQRRYVDSLSAYARQFLGGTNKPDVDSIEGLSPSISIDQKSTNNNPRSTVGTVTEIYDFLRLLYARIGIPYCPNHHKPITSQSIEEMTIQIMKLDLGTKIRVLSPVVYGEKGTQKSLLDELRKEGFARVRVDGEDFDLSSEINLEKNKKHFIEIIVDRLIIKEDIRSRLYEAIEIACKKSNGKCIIDVLGGEEIVMSEKYACPLMNTLEFIYNLLSLISADILAIFFGYLAYHYLDITYFSKAEITILKQENEFLKQENKKINGSSDFWSEK